MSYNKSINRMEGILWPRMMAWSLQPEDALTWVMFPAVAKDFLPRRFGRVTKRDIGFGDPVDGMAYPV